VIQTTDSLDAIKSSSDKEPAKTSNNAIKGAPVMA
jgi:hypothetical protein